MQIQKINSNYSTTEFKKVDNKQFEIQNNNTTFSHNISMPKIANNYFSSNIAFGNKFSNFVTDDNQNLFLELSDKSQKAASVTVSAIKISSRRGEQDIIEAATKTRHANGKFRLPVGFFDRIDNSPLEKIALQNAVFFDAKGNEIEKLELVVMPNSNGEITYKTKRTIGEDSLFLDKNIVYSPKDKQTEIKLKSVIIDDYESKENVEIFATAKSEGKLKFFDSYENLKNYDGEKVIAILTPKASAEMFNDMIMSTVMDIKSPEYQAKLNKLKEDLNSGKISQEKFDAEVEVQRIVNEDFMLPLNIKGLIAPMQKNINVTSLFSSLGHVRARLQNRQSVLFAPESFTKMLTEHYSEEDKIKMSVFPTGLKINKIDNYTKNDVKVVLNQPQYVNELLTFDNSEELYNEASVGVKANNLRILSQHAEELGIKIPETFVIPAGFVQRMGLDLDTTDKNLLDYIYTESLSADNNTKGFIRNKLREELGRMQVKIMNKTIPDDCRAELEQMLKKTGLDKTKGIVRSSMNGEDNKNLQTAGLYDSVLFDGLDEFWDSMKRVVASKWSYMAYLSRMQNEIPHDDVSVNMPVQKLVDGDYIGTAYTADARVGDKNKLIVQMAPGIDCTIAGTPYTFTTDTVTGDVDRILARKERKKPLYLMSKKDMEKKLEYELTDYSRDFWNASPEQYRPELRKINNVLKKIREKFGNEQDVEFVLTLNRNEQGVATSIKDIYAVQTRDIKM